MAEPVLLETLQAVRRRRGKLVAPLEPEDLMLPGMGDCRPPHMP